MQRARQSILKSHHRSSTLQSPQPRHLPTFNKPKSRASSTFHRPLPSLPVEKPQSNECRAMFQSGAGNLACCIINQSLCVIFAAIWTLISPIMLRGARSNESSFLMTLAVDGEDTTGAYGIKGFVCKDEDRSARVCVWRVCGHILNTHSCVIKESGGRKETEREYGRCRLK